MDMEKFAVAKGAESPQSAIVYGAPKVGKTTLVAQLARKYKVLWIDGENGHQTLFTALPREFWPNLNLIHVQDTGDQPNFIKTVGKLLTKNVKHKVCHAHGVISCIECSKAGKSEEADTVNLFELGTDWVVVFDSLTQLSDSAMAHTLGPVDTFDKKKIEFDHYDRQGLLLKNVLTAHARLNCHVVFISHEEELDQEDGTKKICPVGGTRNFSRKVARYFDHAIYLEIKNKSHRAISTTTSSLKIQAGSRNRVNLEEGDDITELFKADPTRAPSEPIKFGLPKASKPVSSDGKPAKSNPLADRLRNKT